MSEPNSPLNSQEHSLEESEESSLNWWNPFPELPEETDLVEQCPAHPSHAGNSSHSEDKTNSQNVPAKKPRSSNRPVVEAADLATHGEGMSASHVAVIAAWSENAANQTDPPNLADLISLIQELNQCNGVLLDRVSQLEEALERSQQALQSQGERSPDSSSPYDADDLATAQAQIATLFSQLEFAHQTNQRQQILTETLTAELESSQERVAQLEREAALLQQRYNEQSQLLVQSEGSCRDLQARLQRQQRYTLQFKAALEKCLEMPAPQYEGLETIAPPTDILALPRVQQIQPWSTPGQSVDPTLPWMKLHSGVENLEVVDVEVANETRLLAASEGVEPELTEAEAALIAELEADESFPARSKVIHLDLPTFNEGAANGAAVNLNQFAEPIESQAMVETSDAVVQTNLPSPISYDLKAKDNLEIDPALIEHLSTTVQPLADMLAEAMLTATQSVQQDAEFATSEAAELQVNQLMSIEAIDEAPVDEVLNEVTESSADDVMIHDPDALLASAMNEAEDALWQDLARLIEVSTEDVVKASLSGDLAAFESINFAAIETKSDIQPPETVQLNQPVDSVQRSTSPAPYQPASQDSSLVENEVADAVSEQPNEPKSDDVLSPLAANLSWPSPLLNPLRPPKGKRSLSHVELPSFVRQESSNPIAT